MPPLKIQLPVKNETSQVKKISVAREFNTLQKRYKETRKELGKARESDSDESDMDLEPGCTLIHKLFLRQVILQPDGKTVIKSGGRIDAAEAEALRVASEAGLLVPRLHKVTVENGKTSITMDLVEGQSLDKLWPSLVHEEKKSIAVQLRSILTEMRSMAPPPNHVGSCAGDGHIRDGRAYHTYYGPKCADENAFNQYLLGECAKSAPALFKEAIQEHMRTDHKIVFTHGDLAPRNIMVQDGKVTGIIDWEDGGWYPEYWEYVKYFQRLSGIDGDWSDYAKDIFPQCYSTELILYTALSRMQFP